MKVAVIGSRNITGINLKEYISVDVTEIVSGGAVRGGPSRVKRCSSGCI